MFNLIYFEIDELLTVLAGTWCRQSRPWEHDVPASRGNTQLVTIRASSRLFTSEHPEALCLTSPIWSQSSARVSQLFFSKPQPLNLGQKVLFSSAEGNTKIPTPQTLAGVWTAMASDFAVLSVSLSTLLSKPDKLSHSSAVCLSHSIASMLPAMVLHQSNSSPLE